jgi:uncharacterized membrane protein YvbJ
MVCKICGRQIGNEEANFCEYCGSSLKDTMSGSYNMVSPQQTVENNAALKTQNMVGEQPISLLNWLGTYGLLLIPFGGWLVYLIMLFVWAFGKDTPQSKKNWSRATLIYTAVTIVIVIYSFFMFVNSPMYQQMLSGKYL